MAVLCTLATNASALTENAVMASVSDHFPLILAATDNIQRAKADYLSAQGAFDPIIRSNFLVSPNGTYKYGNFGADVTIPIENSGNKVFTGYRIGRGTYPPYDQNLETYNYGEVRVGFEVPFMQDRDIDKRRTKIQKASIDTSISEYEYRLEKLKAEYDASVAYWDWYTDGKQLQLQRHLLTLAEERQSALDKSVKAGDLAEVDALDNKRIIMQRKSLVKMTDALFKKSALVLSLYYRDKTGVPVVCSERELPASGDGMATAYNRQNIESRVAMIVNNHPKIKIFQEKYASALASLKQASNEYQPKLNNKFYLAQDMGGGNPPLNKTTLNYEINFEIPMFQREARGQVEAATNLIKRIDKERKMESDNISVSIRKYLVEIDALKSVINVTKSEVDLTQRVENAESVRYQHGDSNLFTLNQRELMTVEAQSRYLNIIKNYNVSVANLRYALG